jgi:hypothetical protein
MSIGKVFNQVYKVEKPKDKIKYEFNVFTEELDIVKDFNENRIITSEYKADGTRRNILEDGFKVVCDNNGNVVVR